MNKFTITIELETYSESPEDWITESIIDQLEDGEELVSLSIENKDWIAYIILPLFWGIFNVETLRSYSEVIT